MMLSASPRGKLRLNAMSIRRNCLFLAIIVLSSVLSSVHSFSIISSHLLSDAATKTSMHRWGRVGDFQSTVPSQLRATNCRTRFHQAAGCIPRGGSFHTLPPRQNAATAMKMAQVPPLTDGKGAESQDPKWSELASWATESGLKWQKWVVGEVAGIQGLRGAIATQNLKEDEVIVSAPPEATIMVRVNDPCPFPASFLSAEYWDEMSEFWNMRMGLRLLFEKRKGDESTFAPYIKVLPEAFTTPMCWTDAEVQELQWEPLIEDINVERTYFAYEGKRLQKAMQDPPTQEELFWALSCAGTRSFTADYGDPELNGELMCPIADMVNHDYRAKPAFRYIPDTNEFELFAPVPFKRGDQVCISYGDVNNEHLLHYYGFIPGVNGFDHFSISEKEIFLALPSEEATDQALMEGRMAVLRLLMEGSGAEGGTVLTKPLEELAESSVLFEGGGSDIKIFPGREGLGGALMYARAVTLGATALLSENVEGLAKKVQGGRPLSPDSERKANKFLAGVLAAQLEGMGTSLDQDRTLLDEATSGQVEWEGSLEHYTLALRYRIGRKQMVTAALEQLT